MTGGEIKGKEDRDVFDNIRLYKLGKSLDKIGIKYMYTTEIKHLCGW